MNGKKPSNLEEINCHQNMFVFGSNYKHSENTWMLRGLYTLGFRANKAVLFGSEMNSHKIIFCSVLGQ